MAKNIHQVMAECSCPWPGSCYNAKECIKARNDRVNARGMSRSEETIKAREFGRGFKRGIAGGIVIGMILMASILRNFF